MCDGRCVLVCVCVCDQNHGSLRMGALTSDLFLNSLFSALVYHFRIPLGGSRKTVQILSGKSHAGMGYPHWGLTGETYEGEKKSFLPSSLHLLITRRGVLTPTLIHTHVEDHVNVARVTRKKESRGFGRKEVSTATP